MWVPAIEVAQQNGNFVVSAELPGVQDADVRVEVSEDALVIRGERRVSARKRMRDFAGPKSIRRVL